MKIALAQLNYHTGNFTNNTHKIIEAIIEAKNKGAELVVFAELAVCGYPPRDFLEFDNFLLESEKAVQNIADASQGIYTIVGAPTKNNSEKGKDLFNSALVLKDGKIIHKVHKTLLPTYDIFDENRYFEPNSEFNLIEINGKKIALTICEDIWNVDNNPLYKEEPMQYLIKQKPELIINIAASPFSFTHAAVRSKILKFNAQNYHIPIVYVNHIGAQTEIIFDGDSRFVDARGENIVRLDRFKEAIAIVDTKNTEVEKAHELSKMDAIYQALILGVRDYFSKLSLHKATLGLSGGIDSAVVFCLAVEALGAENVLPVLLPSKYTSDLSNSEAVKLAQNLGCDYKLIPIEDTFNAFTKTLAPHFKGMSENVTEENLQSRSRGVILMALSNKLGYILLNTTNKSEMAVGYGTLYGDLCGGISVIGDLYKTEVYELARYINRNSEIIPDFIITRPPSAELKEDQKDSDSLPDYAILDPLLKAYIEEQKGPKELAEMGFDPTLVKRVLKMVNSNEWKRHQTAPILRVSNKAFGMGRRMPIVAKYLS